MARIIETDPGSDGLVRVATILSEGRCLKRAVHASDQSEQQPSFSCPGVYPGLLETWKYCC